MRISTHTSHAGCDSINVDICSNAQISTHTSHAGCDGLGWTSIANGMNISTHTSHAGCDMFLQYQLRHWKIFLLTHPMRDVTIGDTVYDIFMGDFYSHIPCGMWPETTVYQETRCLFLLTHPMRDVTGPVGAEKIVTNNFYSHIPCGMWLLCIYHHLLP